MNQIEQCPKCSSFIEGIPLYETKRQVVKGASKWATKKLLIYILTPILGTFVFPVFGTFIGFIIAFVIGLYVIKKSEEVSESVDMSMYSSLPFEFKCSHCGNTWRRTYLKGVDFATDSVLEWQKNQLVESIRSSSDTALKITVVSGIISIPCAIYCFTPFSDNPDYLIWWLILIIGMPTLCITLNYAMKSYRKKKEADELDNMTVSVFRRSSYRSGSPFVGTVRDPNGDARIDTTGNKPSISENKQLFVPGSSMLLTKDKEMKTCPYCGGEILSTAIKCKHCGEWLEQVRCSVCGEKVEKSLSHCPICHEPLHASHLPLDMEEHHKPCIFCGEDILDVAKKCKHCGEWQRQLEPPKKYVPCPICGEDVEEGTAVCPHCNEPMVETKYEQNQ